MLPEVFPRPAYCCPSRSAVDFTSARMTECGGEIAKRPVTTKHARLKKGPAARSQRLTTLHSAVKASISHPTSGHFDLESERDNLDGIEIMQADDGRLGLTNTPRVPADDWAADTGETAVPDAEE